MLKLKYTCIIIRKRGRNVKASKILVCFFFYEKYNDNVLAFSQSINFYQKQHVNFRALKNNLIKILLFRTCSSSLHWHNKKINGVKTDNKNGWVNR